MGERDIAKNSKTMHNHIDMKIICGEIPCVLDVVGCNY